MTALPHQTFQEYCITFRQFYRSTEAVKLFKQTIYDVCHDLSHTQSPYWVFPELQKDGVLHYHILVEFDAEFSPVYAWLVQRWNNKYGKTTRYDVSKPVIHFDEAKDPACKCLECRVNYCRKEVHQMEKFLKFPLPVTPVEYFTYLKRIETNKRAMRKIRRRRAQLLHQLRKMGLEIPAQYADSITY